MAEVSATADPESPAKRMLERMFTWASPARKCPIMVSEKSTKDFVIPPRFINSPASMKKGIASNGPAWIPEIILETSRVAISG